MQGKLRKHQAFEAEVSANRTRIDNVNNSGKALIENEHPKSDMIQDKLDEINGLWDKLVRMSSDKGSKLRDAHRELLFNREVDDMERWIAELELQLYSEDYGRVSRDIVLWQIYEVMNDMQYMIFSHFRISSVCKT